MIKIQKTMPIEINYLIKIFREIIELNEDLFNTMENLSKNYNSNKLMQKYLLEFNNISEELKLKYWIVIKVCEVYFI